MYDILAAILLLVFFVAVAMFGYSMIRAIVAALMMLFARDAPQCLHKWEWLSDTTHETVYRCNCGDVRIEHKENAS